MIGKILCDEPSAKASDAVNWIREFCNHVKIPKLSLYGLTERKFNIIIEKSMRASSMKGNPITLSMDEIRNILQRSL